MVDVHHYPMKQMEKTVEQVTVEQVTVEQMTVEQMTVEQMTVEQMTVEQMTVKGMVEETEEKNQINCKGNQIRSSSSYSLRTLVYVGFAI
jgi:hypothetical protein